MTLYDLPPAQPTATSLAAAAQIAPSANRLRALVLGYIRECGAAGATDEQVQVALNMPGSTERPRRCELVASGCVVDSGMTRKLASGRSGIVWRAA